MAIGDKGLSVTKGRVGRGAGLAADPYGGWEEGEGAGRDLAELELAAGLEVRIVDFIGLQEGILGPCVFLRIISRGFAFVFRNWQLFLG